MANINEQQADSVTFEVVPGLADNNSVSIMIVPRGTRKNYLVLGKDEKLEIDNFERKQSYFERSTFRIVKGLLNGNGVSLKAFGKDKYITKRENDFVLDVNDGTDEFARNSTFLIQPGIFKGKPR
ncbi:MAG: AbfB domain-containing protein [Gemmataceae bacterium]